MSNPNLKENKFKRAIAVSLRGIIKAISPVAYVKCQYRYITHHKCHLNPPVRYTEKLQYLRLFVYPKDDNVSLCAGRVSVRDYVEYRGYVDSLIPVYGIYNSFDEIDFSSLPKSFVMKCSHASGFNEIVWDKDAMDLSASRKRFKKWLKTDYGKKTVEPHYSKIHPQIIIEKLLEEDGALPVEYKIHVFNGKAKNLYVVTGRGEDIRYTELHAGWTPFDGSQFNGWKKADVCPPKPSNFDEMLAMAEKLAKPFPFVRVDLYSIHGKTYFSEMTFTPAKGTLILDDDQVDFEMGEWLDLSAFLPNSK